MTASTPLASWRALKLGTTNPPRRHERRRDRRRVAFGAGIALATLLAACGSDSGDDDTAPPVTQQADGPANSADFDGTLRIGAIPDQDPDVLQRQFGSVADHLAAELGVEVEYIPVTDYQSAVSGFAVGDLDLVWFGGLTGVQAQLEVDGSQAIAQRDIDAEFTSVFIARTDAGIDPFDSVEGLSAVSERSLTFGSESSTSGRLMPQHFLTEAGVDVATDIIGEVGFSGSHDATIEVVSAGTYEVGALNSQVWDARVESGDVDTSEVVEIFRTPTYFDYHWVARPELDDRIGDGFTDAVTDAFQALDSEDPTDAAILELFGAGAFIATENSNYAAIENVARDVGAIRE